MDSTPLGFSMRPGRGEKRFAGFLFGAMVIGIIVAWGGHRLVPPALSLTVAALSYAALVIMRAAFRARVGYFQLKANEQLAADGAQWTMPLVLYLRPFLSAGKLLVRNAMKEGGDRSLLGKLWDAEFAMSLAVEGRAHLVAIGEVPAGVGALKLRTSDESWQEVMKDIARRSLVIVMVPFNRPSTMWEAQYLFHHPDLLRKTMFFMPPTTGSLVQVARRLAGQSPGALWRQGAAELQGKGIHLPAYRGDGRWILLGVDGKVEAQWPVHGMDADHTWSLMSAVAEMAEAPDRNARIDRLSEQFRADDSRFGARAERAWQFFKTSMQVVLIVFLLSLTAWLLVGA